MLIIKVKFHINLFFLRHPCVFIKLLINLQLVIKQFLSKNNNKKKLMKIFSDIQIVQLKVIKDSHHIHFQTNQSNSSFKNKLSYFSD